MIGTRGCWVGLAITVIMLLSGLQTLPAHAQEGGFPPWPIILDGHVAIDGEPLENGKVTARIGDWTSVSVPVVDGWFACAEPCLIIGPPSAAYLDVEVTFHLENVKRPSEYKFVFTQLTEPQRKTVTLEFTRGFAVEMWMIAGMGVLALVVGGGVVALILKRENAS